MIKQFTDKAWKDYLYWQTTNSKQFKQINKLIQAIERDPFIGIGKPEPLKANLQGWWSRRINLKDRIIYKVETQRAENILVIISIRGHYD